jgi:hypothetical protein
MHARWVRLVVTFVLGAVVAFWAPPASAAPKAGACELLTTDELSAALSSSFQPGSPYSAGTGTTCGYNGLGPVRGATVRVARGKQASGAMAKTLKALRDTLKSIHSKSPAKVAGLGDKAYYSLDDFLREASIEVLHGKTFIQVTAIVAPGGDTKRVSMSNLRSLAKQALKRAK